MCKKDCNSAQCAWLFSHAHLIGETGIELEVRYADSAALAAQMQEDAAEARKLLALPE